MNNQHKRPARALATMLAATTIGVTACGGTSTPAAIPATTTASSTVGSAAADGSTVLPVTSNPISNTATAVSLVIDEVLVENNVDASTGATADDHLEIAVRNSGADTLSGFEVFYTITDPTTGEAESYYTSLPDSFDVVSGSTRRIHFDNSGAVDHFADNAYSLYHTSMNGLEFSVTVSAGNAAPQTVTVLKDPGGDEVAD